MLGSGKSLLPPGPPRSSSLVSPSESTVSLPSSRDETASPLGTSPLPETREDLLSAVSLENGGGVAAGSSKLVCPICAEEMVGFAAVSSMRA